jgi:hypothetical protein
MIPGNLVNEPFSDFLEKITSFIIPKMAEITSDESEKLLDQLSLKIKEEINKCQS